MHPVSKGKEPKIDAYLTTVGQSMHWGQSPESAILFSIRQVQINMAVLLNEVIITHAKSRKLDR